MTTNFTFKTSVLSALLLLIALTAFAQKPVTSGTKAKASVAKEAHRNQNLPDNNVDPNDTISVIDTVMLMEKTSNAFHFRIDPKEGSTIWRYRLMGDLPEDMEVEPSMWTTGMSVDTCCITLDNLDAQNVYVVQFGRISESMPEPVVWYSMVETTRCMGLSLDQLKLIGLDDKSASMMCEMDAESFEWVLQKVGSSTARHIETISNSIEWTNLPANTAHECRVRYMCGGIWSDYSPADIFTTKEYVEYTCDPLATNDVYTSDVSINDVKLNCSMQGSQYSWGMRLSGTETWSIYTTGKNSYTWPNLKPGKTYEYKVKVECQNDAWTDWSGSHYFTTKHENTSPCYPPSSGYMSVKNVTYNSASTYCNMDGLEYHWAVKPYGSGTWKDYKTPKSYYHWTGLNYNTKYEYKVKVKCHSGGWTDWSASYWFTTHDHYGNACSTPKAHQMTVKDLTYHSAITHCSVDGYKYHWMLKEYGSSNWLDYCSSTNFYSWTNLHYKTKYEYKVKVKCHNGTWTSWSDSYWFTTPDHYGNSCTTPSSHHMSVKDLTYNSATTHCSVDGYGYHWMLKAYGSNSWKDHNSTYNYHNWTGLHYNTKYEYKVKVKCHDGTWTGWSDSYWFTTYDHHDNSCTTPQSHHMSVKNLTYNSASTYCSVDGYEYHWMLKAYGSSTWQDKLTPNAYHHWTGLHYNTKYEYKVKVKCYGGTWTGWSSSYWFTTPDHYDDCSTPKSQHMSVKDLTYNSATTHCAIGGTEYHWQLKPYGSSSWIDHTSTHGYHQWNGLHYNTKYEYKVKVKCHNGTWTGWSGVYWFQTPDHYNGCSTPQSHHMSVKNLTYNSASTHCSVDGYEYHWALRQWGGYGWIDYTSAYNYHNWTNLNYNTKYEYKVKVKCHDGSWTDWSDVYWFQTYDHYSSCSTPESHHMSVKDLTYNSATTHCGVSGYEYHWMLKAYGSNTWQDYATPNNYQNWSNLHYNTKYEYKVKVKCHSGTWTGWSNSYWFTTYNHSGYGCSAPYGAEFTIQQQAYNLFRIYMYAPFTSWSSQIRKSGTYEWAGHTTSVNNMAWGNLDPSSQYEYRVQRTCADGTKSDWSVIRTFWTGSGPTTSSGRPDSGSPLEVQTGSQLLTLAGALSEETLLEMYPNPASNVVSIVGLQNGSEITIVDMQGRQVLRKVLGSQENLDVRSLDNGIYQVLLVDQLGHMQTKRLAIVK